MRTKENNYLFRSSSIGIFDESHTPHLHLSLKISVIIIIIIFRIKSSFNGSYLGPIYLYFLLKPFCVADRGSTHQQRKQSFEEHDDDDECVDEVNDVGFQYPLSKPPIGKESDSPFAYCTPPPRKRSALLCLL